MLSSPHQCEIGPNLLTGRRLGIFERWYMSFVWRCKIELESKEYKGPPSTGPAFFRSVRKYLKSDNLLAILRRIKNLEPNS